MKNKSGELYLRAFVIAFLGCMIALLPVMILNGGRFFYYGDFNKQQVMFYTHLHDLVRGGELAAWDPLADLGSDTVSSFSFYLLGSPFFWLTVPLPSAWVVSAIPVLIAVKSGVAAVGAYAFIRRFCNSPDASLMGAMLFGLSSYNSANLLFNHFHDAVLMIPFMLLALEKLVIDGKRGYFALTIALAAFINYYFFFGQVIFLVVYYLAALAAGHFKFSFARFAQIVFEGILGGLLAAVLLLPSAMAIVNNPRVSETLSGSGLFFYDRPSTYLFILKNMLLLPDITLINNFGMTTGQASGSFASYLPFFSLCGVIAYFRAVKGRDIFKLLIALCGVMMFIPALNQAFSLWSPMFYGRWFYMPLFIACVMTSKAAENGVLKKGFVPTAVITGTAAAASLAVIMLSKSGVLSLGFDNYSFAYLQAAFTLTALAFLWLTLYRPESSEEAAVIKQLLKRASVFAAAGLCTVVWCSYLYRGTFESDQMNSVFDYYESGETLPDGAYYRTSSDANLQNMPVIWGCPCVRYFNSTVEPSITGFYNAFGFERTVKSDYEPTEYALMELLSVKYYIDGAYFDQNGDPLPPAETIYGTKDTYRIMYQKNEMNFYENTEFLPMGFAFDSYTTNEALQGQPSLMRGLAYLEALVLSEEQIRKYGDILDPYDTADISTAADRYHEICAERRSMCCSSFKMSKSRFDAEITLEKPSLVFFSVPYSEGWSAEVNGKSAEVENVDNGMMAVKCEAGQSSISFTYHNKYLSAGAFMTLGAALLLAAYFAAGGLLHKKSDEQEDKNE